MSIIWLGGFPAHFFIIKLKYHDGVLHPSLRVYILTFPLRSEASQGGFSPGARTGEEGLDQREGGCGESLSWSGLRPCGSELALSMCRISEQMNQNTKPVFAHWPPKHRVSVRKRRPCSTLTHTAGLRQETLRSGQSCLGQLPSDYSQLTSEGPTRETLRSVHLRRPPRLKCCHSGSSGGKVCGTGMGTDFWG